MAPAAMVSPADESSQRKPKRRRSAGPRPPPVRARRSRPLLVASIWSREGSVIDENVRFERTKIWGAAMQERLAGKVDAIRKRVLEERAIVSRMNAGLGRDLRDVLQDASYLLDDVEMFFMSPATLREPRSFSELSQWLDGASRVLDQAVARRLSVQKSTDKFGGSRLIG
jgi:hypothetical protein